MKTILIEARAPESLNVEEILRAIEPLGIEATITEAGNSAESGAQMKFEWEPRLPVELTLR